MYQEYGFAPELVALVDLGDQALWTALVLAITLVVALWPAVVAARFRPVEAIRQG
jgi:ABC-type lipoprotein release transport system permease subunit